MTTLGQKVKKFRLDKGWNTTQMAASVGTSRQNIENLETKDVGQPRYLKKLAAIMGVTTDELLSNKPLTAPAKSTGAPQEEIGIRIPSNLPDIQSAVETIAQALMHIPEGERAAVLGKFGVLEHAPDSPQLKQAIVKALGYVVPDATFAQPGKKAA